MHEPRSRDAGTGVPFRGLHISASLMLYHVRAGDIVLTSVVLAGNNYAITNESRTKTAKIFFAQGCEVDASGSSTVA